ncbi:TetR/AcrR family transcriptional regulator [Bradyrhizobium cenepequi]|uniref:TetR/AcrR family transcriptional regulator n=1 Tax=Bradyrhizobium cenepequi TaxID=2821403 RepID=UPI001CE2DB92|nr:helix-turn-helix domain-containing protein [Bradyrhizobium cenepequi]MCA6111556.1 helix-turn-helix transcriptional regulator [Bradyrhizobium cenepequi]
MSATSDTGAARHVAILKAATSVFLRYGFKKTSMDDVAQAIVISRHRLYLHFQTKETLFRAMVTYTLEAMRAPGKGGSRSRKIQSRRARARRL